MFGILKKKLKKAVEAVSKRFERKERIAKSVGKEVEERIEEVAEKPEKVEEVIEKIPEVKPVAEEIKEKIKEAVEEAERKPEEKKSIIKRVVERVVKRVVERRLTAADIEPVLNELVTDLIEADVALETAERIKEYLEKSLVGREIKRGKERELVIDALKQSLLSVLRVPQIELLSLEKKPAVLVFFGFNGSGKTTSIAKCAKWLIENGKSCVFAAADTFRAASIEQLGEHAKRLGVKLIKHKYGADPAAVVYDAVEHAKAKGIDYVLADTAGRVHTNKDLIDEMKKIVRVNKPDLRILVIDSLTGNDAVMQARMFDEIGVDAVIFTKVDVNEKGGAILSVTHELKKPILFLGIGQRYEDLERFDAEKFVEKLLQV